MATIRNILAELEAEGFLTHPHTSAGRVPTQKGYRYYVDYLMEEIQLRIEMGDRILVTTLTKRMAEELTKFLMNAGVDTRYIHSEVDTLDRVEILRQLRLGEFNVLVGVNLLREGLDLPEVSLVAIIDADKEGFLRNERSMIQTIGRASRNDRGKVIMYADKMTGSMQRAIDETNRRRGIQNEYNEKHGITPQTVRKSQDEIMEQTGMADKKKGGKNYYMESEPTIAADPVVEYMSQDQLKKLAKESKRKMEKAAKDMDFMDAARFRDEWMEIEKLISSK